jgi:uncharacterized protein
MWIRIASAILRNRLLILFLLGGLTLFMGYQARNIEMSYHHARLLPNDDPAYKEFERFLAVFGSEDNLLVLGVQDERFFDLDHFKNWEKLSQDLRAIHGVQSVLSVTEAFDLVKNGTERKFELKPHFKNVTSQEALDSLKERFLDLPFYKEQLYNPETHAYLMAVTLVPEVLESPERVSLMEQIKATGTLFEERTGLSMKYSGLPYIRVAAAEMIKEELNMFIFLALGVTSLLIFLFFKSFKVVLFSMLVVVITVIWALGSQALLGYKITILTGMIPPLIIVIGIPNAVFLINKFHQEFRKHGNKIKSLHRVIRKIGVATLLTNLTTACGFATFIFTSSRVLIEFGVVASINIMVIFILSLLLIPIIFSFLPDPKERHIKHLDNKIMVGLVDRLLSVSLYHRKVIFGISAVMLLAGVYGITKVKTTGFMLDDIPKGHVLSSDLRFFEGHFNGLMPLEIYIDTKKQNGVIQSSTIRKIDELQLELDSFPELSKPISFVEAVKFSKQAYYNGNPAYYRVPNQQERNFILSYIKNGQTNSSDMISSFIDSTRQITRVSYRMEDVGTNRMESLDSCIRARVGRIFPPEDYETFVTGASIIFFKGTKYLIQNLFISVFLAILLIASLMAWMFSSKRMVLVSLIPNLIPLIMTAALMGYFGIPIKPSTVLVFSIAFGISVDGTIHFLAKYRQELRETNWSIRAAVVLAFKESGLSMIYTSIILFFGFGIFSVSEFGGTVALGSLVAITLLIALFANLILLPSLLLSLEKMITDKSFKEPMLDITDEDEEYDFENQKIRREVETALDSDREQEGLKA